MTELVPVSRSTKLALKEAPLKEVAETLLGELPVDKEAPQDFPKLPDALTATAEIRAALKTLSTTFNKTVVTERRTMTTEEVAAIGVEYEAIQRVAKLLEERAEQIKEIVRTHQDVEAEEQGLAFPKDVVHNGTVVAPATPRDAKGHYLLAAKGAPRDTQVPGTTLKFSAQFTSGRSKTDLDEIQRMYEAGEIDETEYKAMTVVRRVPDEAKVKTYVLKSGRVDILGRIVKKGRDGTALYLRSLKKK